jgi:hypothetical protein
MGNLITSQLAAALEVNQRTAGESQKDQAVWSTGPMPDLQAVLGVLAPLPSGSALLGICDDGLPLLLDLKNPSPGSLLLVGDLSPANRNLLRLILASIVLLHDPGEVDLHLVTDRPETYRRLLDVPGAVRIHSPYDPQLPELIRDFACRANQRLSGRQTARIAVLGIEDLETVVSQLSEDRLSELAWLASTGPMEGSWVLAGLDAAHFGELDPVLFQAFRTRLVGSSADRKTGEYLSGLPAAVGSSLDPGVGYCVKFAGDLIRFWLPRFTEIVQPERRLVKGE